MLALLGYGTAFAQSGAAFLKVPVGARPVGMGGAYSAVADDVTSLHWNPAGLARLSRKELGLMHSELFADTRLNFVGFALPVKRRAGNGSNPWSFGFSAIYLSQGEIQGYDENRQKTGGFEASDLAFSLGLGRKLTGRTSLGGGVKLLRQTIGSDQANGWAAGVGLQTRLSSRLSVGAAALNLGPALTFVSEKTPLPLTLSAGAGYRLSDGLTLAGDLRHRPQDSATTIGCGAELQVVHAFVARAGYLSALASPSRTLARDSAAEQLSGLAAGFGVRILGSQLDYAITPMGEFGQAQRLSLTLRF